MFYQKHRGDLVGEDGFELYNRCKWLSAIIQAVKGKLFDDTVRNIRHHAVLGQALQTRPCWSHSSYSSVS